jgi:hypothetical protein
VPAPVLGLLGDAVGDRVRGVQEQRRSAGRDLVARLLDEVVVDADLSHRAHQRAHARTDGQADERDEEDQAEEQAPEGTAEGARHRGVAQLTRLRLLGVGRPRDHGAVDDR